ncbi:MAG: hypothetical protein DME24_06060 [Verrucomicrobia bacterium]|nr:MAG: hypothetical protein DME24_06060 [Verrucomicrobiota bacterium]
MGSEHLQNLDANRSHEPVGIPLNRPPGTFSPSGGEGRDEGVRFMENQMRSKCFFIGIGLSPGAVPQHFMALGRELARRGHKVVILSWPPRAEIENHDGNPAVWSWPSSRPTRFKDARFLHKLTRQYRPNCFVANFAAVNVMTLVGALCRVPVRVCWHHTLTNQIALDAGGLRTSQRFQILRKSCLFRLATHIVANSKASADDSHRVYGVPDRRCHVSHFSLPDPRAGDVDLNGFQADTHLVCVGRLAGCKGQDVLVKAAAKLKSQGVPFVLQFIGDGPMAGSLRTLASDLDVADRCQFLGNLSHETVLAHMARSAATIVPSKSEAFGLVCVESLAVGVPVVASRVGGIPEIIRDGLDGFLVQPSEPGVLAEKLALLLSDSTLRRKMQQSARERFLSTFEQGRVIPQQADWFEQILCAA